MKSRNITIDIARGFIVFIMPATHATLYYSRLSVQEGPWGILLRCFAEGAGAQVFMFLLGFSFFLGTKKPLKVIVKRSASIFCLAYLLNLVKFVLPVILGIIPSTFFKYYHISQDFFGVIDLLMVGDIFQFAAISYFICGLRRHYNDNWVVPVFLGIAVIIASPLIWGLRVDNFLIDYLLKLFNGAPPAVFFPFFPWGVYPLLGLGFGQLYKILTEGAFYRTCLKVGGICVTLGLLGMQFEPAAFNLTFYRLGPSGTILHCGLVLLWLCFCRFIAVKVNQKVRFLDVMKWCSINITIIYIIQWVVIVYLLPLFGFMELELFKTLMAVLIVNLITCLIVHCARGYKKRKIEKDALGIQSV